MKNNKKKDDKKFYTNLYKATTIGFSVVFAVAIGGALGLWIDNIFPKIHPWGFFIFLFLGIVAGFENLFRGLKEITRENNDKNT